LVIILFGAVFSLLAFNPGVYQYLYEKTGTYDVLGEEQAVSITINVFNYLRHHEELRYFSASEQEHMSDVRNVIDNSYLAVYVSFVICLILFIYVFYIQKKKHVRFPLWLGNSAQLAGVITLILVVLLGFLGLNFSWFFEQFHSVFFPQGNYTFASGSLLITIFSEGFFVGLSVILGVAMLIGGLLYLWSGYFLTKLASHNHRTR